VETAAEVKMRQHSRSVRSRERRYGRSGAPVGVGESPTRYPLHSLRLWLASGEMAELVMKTSVVKDLKSGTTRREVFITSALGVAPCRHKESEPVVTSIPQTKGAGHGRGEG